MKDYLQIAQDALQAVLDVGRGTSGRLILEAPDEKCVRDALDALQAAGRVDRDRADANRIRPVTSKEKTIVQVPTSITVEKEGQQVFHAESGRLGRSDSACCDFRCFASGVIGASYTVLEDAANRLATLGYRTTFHPTLN